MGFTTKWRLWMEKDSNTIFVNYRREDGGGEAGRICDRLIQEFGKNATFMDVDNIPLGVNFKEFLEKKVAKCSVLLVVMGKQWLNIKDNAGNRRIDDPSDFVSIEIMAALNRNIPVIPLFVHNASMPSVNDLPDRLKKLAYRNGISIRHEYFHDDINRLIKGIRESFLTAEESEGTKTSDIVSSIVEVQSKMEQSIPTGTLKQKTDIPSITPENIDIYINQGNEKYEKEDFDGAIKDYSESIRLNPQNAIVYNKRGNAKFNKEDYDEAIKDYDKAIQLNPNDPDAYYDRGEAKHSKEDYDEAIKDYDKAIQLNPNDSEFYYHRGNAKCEKEDFNGAIKDYDKAIQLNPNDSEFYNNRGDAKLSKEDYDGAIEDYDKAIHLNPKNANFYWFRGIAKFNKEDFDGAIKDYDETIRLDPQIDDAHNNRGFAKYKKGDLAGAILDYNEAIRINPKSAYAYNNRGNAKKEKGDAEGAILDFNEANRLLEKIVPIYNNKGIYGKDLLNESLRYFVCNTNRRATKDYSETLMYKNSYAMAWEDFSYPEHMKNVRKKDIIFMFAKGVGIIGIAEVLGSCEVFSPSDPKTLDPLFNSKEWRIPVLWHIWVPDKEAYKWKSPNTTFIEVTKDKYKNFREECIQYFVSKGILKDSGTTYPILPPVTKEAILETKKIEELKESEKIENLAIPEILWDAFCLFSIDDLRSLCEIFTKNRRKSKEDNLRDILAIVSINEVLKALPIDSLKMIADYIKVPRRKSIVAQIEEIKKTLNLPETENQKLPENSEQVLNKELNKDDDSLENVNKKINNQELQPITQKKEPYQENISSNENSSSLKNVDNTSNNTNQTQPTATATPTPTPTPTPISKADTSIYSKTAKAKFEQGDYIGAIEEYTKILQLNPQNVGVYYNRGLMKYKTGDIEGSKSDFKKFLESTKISKNENPNTQKAWMDIFNKFPDLKFLQA